MDSTKAWRTANELLGTVKNLSPTAIVYQKEGEESPDLITISPEDGKYFQPVLQKEDHKT